MREGCGAAALGRWGAAQAHVESASTGGADADADSGGRGGAAARPRAGGEAAAAGAPGAWVFWLGRRQPCTGPCARCNAAAPRTLGPHSRRCRAGRPALLQWCAPCSALLPTRVRYISVPFSVFCLQGAPRLRTSALSRRRSASAAHRTQRSTTSCPPSSCPLLLSTSPPWSRPPIAQMSRAARTTPPSRRTCSTASAARRRWRRWSRARGRRSGSVCHARRPQSAARRRAQRTP